MESSSRLAPPDGHEVDAVRKLAAIFASSRSVAVLTGAGCSTESGIPDYRGDDGEWKRPRPMLFDEFRRSAANRRRYWARNYVGWPRVRDARPNGTHASLAMLERAGIVSVLVTQNVDGLHSSAGHQKVIELHGNANRVVCLACLERFDRAEVQIWLEKRNPDWHYGEAVVAPDADAVVREVDVASFEVVDCPRCGGDLKPDVVFFGESVRKSVVNEAFAEIDRCDLLVVAGSSLKVWSGFRFVKRAASQGTPVAIVNRGKTRGDDLASLRLRGSCGVVLADVTRELGLSELR